MRIFAPLAALLLLASGCSRIAQSPDSPVASANRTTATASASVSASASPSATADAVAAALGDYDTGHDAKQDIRKALAAAAADKRNVLIDFGADWCTDCRVLAKLGQTPAVAPLLGEHYHVVSVDVGEFDKNLGVAESYDLNLNRSGIPALVVLTPAGKVRFVSNDGSFEDARHMTAGEVAAFLRQWA